jgi:hypothetical protein
MSFKIPKDDHKFRWTNHVVRKMQYYGLTPSRVLRVIRAPERTEDGVAEGTLAAMQTAGTKAKPWEVWVMWKELAKPSGPLGVSKRVVITAWRYPGVSPVRERVPIPSDIVAELEREGILDSE